MEDNISLKAFVVLLKAAKTVEGKVTDDISSYDMKVPEFTVLEALYHKGAQTVRQISNAVLIKFGSITYVIDKLETKGLVKRVNSETDRRVVYIHITDDGKKLMDQIFPKHQKVIEEMFHNIHEDERVVLIDLLKRIGKGR